MSESCGTARQAGAVRAGPLELRPCFLLTGGRGVWYTGSMDEALHIYMDCCCLNRPADDQTQDKIRIESDTIKAVLTKCYYGPWVLVGSDALEFEIINTPDLNKRTKALDLYRIKKEVIALNDEIQERALEIQRYGIKSLDSLHFASAEYRGVDVLLTVDKDFIRYAKQIRSSLVVENPISWFMEEIEND
jgi:hypothetical protein